MSDAVDVEIGRLADELGRCAMLNDFASTLATDSDSQSIQKLVLMINVLLDCAHGALTRVRGSLAELATPTIPVWEGVLMVPLMGTLDSERADSLAHSVLPAAVAQRARHVILDLTGTTGFDAVSVASLLQLARALRLLGAEPILVGLRPALAQALVTMDHSMHEFRTLSTLQDALRLSIEPTDGAAARRRG